MIVTTELPDSLEGSVAGSTEAGESRYFELGEFSDPEASGRDSSARDSLAHQTLAQEVAVAFCYNGINHGVMMASPEALEDFAYGFSLSSGVIRQRSQIVDLEVEPAQDRVLLHITLNQRALTTLRVSRRASAGTSGCGLCGVEALAQALAVPTQPSSGCTDFCALPPAAHLSQLRQRFQGAQQHRQSSGAMHGAIYVDEAGRTRICREDIGRHNALDKLIGASLREGLDMGGGFVAITSRCSLELIQKCLRAGIGTLVSLASPSDIAVRWARQYSLNLLHQPAQGGPRLYSGAVIKKKLC
ncbi:formate dehydrogenase accessory sulfurtransferase FdhD [uncultured Microbulbifer sp.]|uniref:formate dehydrogenase accessory sulfurtransferase FdhD n=1 Tax=uncultured Microbulbifer sp. TaxID=348147 RepID=UPI00260A6EC2|nr:formate dehydrogenase accessory sulfurtransferase FdhD [uncultured Microbulbifer sp.]